MRHLSCTAALLLVAVCASLTPEPVRAAGGVRAGQTQVGLRVTQALPPSELLSSFRSAVTARHASPQELARLSTEFQKLTPEFQAAIVASFAPQSSASSLGAAAHRSAGTAGSKVQRLSFGISALDPEVGECGLQSVAGGAYLTPTCKVLLDGKQVSTLYADLPPDYPQSLFFWIPTTTTPLDADHTLSVLQTSSGVISPEVKYHIIAQRGYRGKSGWQFFNFPSSWPPWYLYRDYFGSGFVAASESDASQAAIRGYSDFFFSAGSGGNCFGMSVSSLRLKLNAMRTYYKDWFGNSANKHALLWDYPWVQQTKESAMEDQGGQFSQEFLAAHLTNYNSQKPQDVWNRVKSLLADPANPPVLLMWGHGWGHAIIPYGTSQSNNMLWIECWDNNDPYSKTEAYREFSEYCGIGTSSGSLMYHDTYNCQLTPKHFVCMSYKECTPTSPHITTTGYTNNPAALVGVAAPGTQVTQITDEAGHTFFAPNGDTNENAATRIPNSAPFFPMVAGPSPLTVAAKQPTLFTFGTAAGKSLTFQFRGTGAQKLSLYLGATIFHIEAAGGGQVRFLDLLRDTCRMEVLSPSALRPSSLQIIRTAGNVEHTFQLSNLTGLGTQALSALPSADGTSLKIQAPPGTKFDLSLIGPVGQGQASFKGIAVQPNLAAAVGAENWSSLRTSGLLLRHMNAAGAVQQTVHVPRAR